MTIAQAREAAKRISEQPVCDVDARSLSNFILDHFPEDGEEMIDTKWILSEYEGTGSDGDCELKCNPHGGGPVCYLSFSDYMGCDALRVHDTKQEVYLPANITTRHQARQLFQALGIKKRGE